jgi:hypothetical protein
MPEIVSRNTVYQNVFDINVRSASGCPFVKKYTAEPARCGHPLASPAFQKKSPCTCALESTEDLEECLLEKHPVMLRRVPGWLDKAIDDATWKHSMES